MGSLFVSHSSQDGVAVSRLCAWLTEHGFSSLFLGFDPDRGIAPGAKWEAELYARLRRADAVLFVGSPASVASQWCFAELAMARSLGKPIVPVAVSAGGSHPLLEDTQAVELTDSFEHGLVGLGRWLSAAELDLERAFAWDPRRPPFPGLESFEERDAAVFFGRQSETEQLLSQLRSSRRRYTGRLLAVVGSSGSGKSSLVRAGVLPRLGRTRPPWVVLSILRPADRPLRQLALVLADAFRDCGAPRSLASVELAVSAGATGLVAIAEELSHLQPGASKPAVLVFVDQAEELLTPATDQEHARFLALLHGATRGAGPVWALLTLRSEFLSAFLDAEHGEFSFDDQVLVGALDASRLAEVIERPAERAGVTFEAGLVGRMVADTGGGDALPLLAHTLAALHKRARGRTATRITIADYEDLGGVVGALRRSADEEQQCLSERGLGDLVIPTLNRLVAVGPEGQPTRRRVARAAFSEHEQEVAQAFIDARLLTSAELDGESVVEVAHEALLRQWPPLRDAIERDRERLQLRFELEREAQTWQRSGRREEYLLPSERLAVASHLSGFAQRTATDLSELERAFLRASQDRLRLQDAAKRRRTRQAFAGLLTAVVVISVVALVAVSKGREAERERDISASRELAVRALSLVDANPGVSLALALEALKLWRTEQAETALRQATLAHRGSRIVNAIAAHKGLAFGVTPSPNGRLAATAGGDHSVRIFNLASGRRVRQFLGYRAPVRAVDFSRDGKRIASAAEDGEIAVAGVEGGPRRKVTRLKRDFATSIDFGANGKTIVIGTYGGRVALVRLSDGAVRELSPGPAAPVWAVGFDSHARRIVSAGTDGARIWNVASGRPLTLGHDRDLLSASFSPDGARVATAGFSGTVALWEARTGHSLKRIRVSDQRLASVRFSGNGRRIVTGSFDGTIHLFAIRRGGMLAELKGHQGPSRADFVPGSGALVSVGEQDGTLRTWIPPATKVPLRSGMVPRFSSRGTPFVVSGDKDGPIHVWNPQTDQNREFTGHKARSYPRISPDGAQIVSASLDGTVRLWDIRSGRSRRVRTPRGAKFAAAIDASGQRIAIGGAMPMALVIQSPDGSVRLRPRGQRAPVTALEFSPDGTHLLTGSPDGAARVWNARSGTLERTLRGHEGTIRDVSYGPTGQIATAGSDETVRVWPAHGGDPTILFGHKSAVNTARFNRRGNRLVSAGDDGTIRIWDATGGDALVVLYRHKGIANGADFDGDARSVVSAGEDGMRITPCEVCGSLQAALRVARTRAQHKLSPAERQRLLPGR